MLQGMWGGGLFVCGGGGTLVWDTTHFSHNSFSHTQTCIQPTLSDTHMYTTHALTRVYNPPTHIHNPPTHIHNPSSPTQGALGRFINHSCDPNCETQKWIIRGELAIGLFAVRDIQVGQELTFDYNFERYGDQVWVRKGGGGGGGAFCGWGRVGVCCSVHQMWWVLLYAVGVYVVVHDVCITSSSHSTSSHNNTAPYMNTNKIHIMLSTMVLPPLPLHTHTQHTHNT